MQKFEQLFDIINQHLSWDEYSFLSEIVDECDSVESEQEIDQYKRKMAVSEALEIISSTKGNPPPGFVKFCFIISKPYTKLTIDKYEEIKTFIFKNLKVNHYVKNKYLWVLFNSLHLEWHVTIQALPHMIKMAREQQAVFTNNSYVFMQIGKEIIINMHTQQESVSLLNSQLTAGAMAAGAFVVHEKNVMQVGLRFKQYRVFLVLDSSESMVGHSWKSVINRVRKILQHLDEDDRISVYLFSDNVREVMSFEPATTINSAALLRLLQENKCGGCTALYDAIALAVQKTLTMSLLAKMIVQDKEKYIVVVLTDGENNRGEMNLMKTREMMGELAKLGELCSTTFIGVNLNYTARSALRSLAEAGGEFSEFHDIGTMEIESIFDRITVTLQAARRVTVQGVVATAGGGGQCIAGAPSRPMLTDSSSNRTVDIMWKLLQDVHQGIKSEYLGNISLSKPNTVGGLYAVLKNYKAALRAEAQSSDWNSYKRQRWLQEIGNSGRYSQAHFASCLLAMEAELREEAQEPLWLMLQRSTWKSACENLGAYKLDLVFQPPQQTAAIGITRVAAAPQMTGPPPSRQQQSDCNIS